MIRGSLVDIIERHWALIYERQWASWELFTIAGATVLLIVLMIGWRRLKETDGRIQKVRTIAPLPEITDHQRLQLLQREIVKRDHTEVRLEREISELTTAAVRLQRRITQLERVNEQLRQEVAAGKKAGEYSKQEMPGLTAADGQLEDDAAEQKRVVGKKIDDRRRKTVQRDQKLVSVSGIGLKVKSPEQQLKELAEEIIDSNTQKGISNSSDATREAILEACDRLEANNAVMAVEALKRFINAVEAQRGDNDGIPQKEEAQDWITAARGIIHLITGE